MGWVLFIVVLLMSGVAEAAPGLLEISWQEPIENVDGSELTDLAGYHIYLNSECPGGTRMFVGAGNNRPYPESILTIQLTNLVAGQTYRAQVTAVNQASMESECSEQRQAVARIYGNTPIPVSHVIFRLYQ